MIFTEIVPSDFIDSQKMPSIGFLVLSGVGARTSVDFTLFCSDNKYILVKFIEVEAETTGESDQGRFFVIF